MNDNPYESPVTAGTPQKTRGIRWALWSGIACLVMAAICTVLAVAWMIASFQTVAQASSTPKPEDVAVGISITVIPAYGIVLFGLVGIILVIVGIVVRRPIEE